jgi:hypothetical protein
MHSKVLTRDIKPVVQMMLWGKAAGRCEFSGCNQQLWKSPVTAETVNIAQKAHIYAFSPEGPRGNRCIPRKNLNDIENLMLVCHACHKTIDQDKDGARYSAELLRGWKTEHERRIEINTGVNPEKKSHVLFYSAKIGTVDLPSLFNSAALAMFPEWYPAEDKPIILPPIKSWPCDHDETFWTMEDKHLVKMFDQRVRQPLQDGQIRHLSVFALAPQPLLVRLGTLLTDISEVQVYPRNREPQGWSWRSHPRGFRYEVQAPGRGSGCPVLVLALSDYVGDDRIVSVFGRKPAIWRVTIGTPNNDFLRSKQQLREFRQTIRSVMGQIKAKHGQETLHIFSAVPAPIAVELGRIRQPKAFMPWAIWDQVNDRGGFIPALTIGGETC